MIDTLSYLVAELNLDISTFCHHLRSKAYPQKSEQIYSAMSSMVFYQILVDELKNLLHAHSQVVEAMEKFLRGDRYDGLYEDSEDQDPIHEYCLRRFAGEFALGSSTPELANWVASHADRRMILRKGFYSFFPDVEFQVIDQPETGAESLRPATEAELFSSETDEFLRDIETSNALVEFNQVMQQAKTMLEKREPIPKILTVLRKIEHKD